MTYLRKKLRTIPRRVPKMSPPSNKEWDESPIQQRVRRVQSLRDQNVNFLEGETSGSVRRIHTAEITDSEVGKVVNSVKAAKASENHVQGQISKSLDFRKALNEVFLFDTGATVSIIGQQVAIDNHVSVNKLDNPCNIVEASGSRLDII